MVCQSEEAEMKIKIITLLISSIFFALPTLAEDNKNYVLSVDGKDYEIGLEGSVVAKTKDGKDITIALKRKEFSTFTKDVVSFEHRSDLSVATTDIERDIHQYLTASALGTLIIIQQYDTLNPATLTELMLKQLSADDLATGYTMDKSDFSRNLSDGTVMKGLRANLKHKNDDVDLQVLATDSGDGGVIAMTRINRDMGAAEEPIIERFWATLKLKKQ
jgi:hypothetical protein